eukprot:CAMPEP_0170167426 /NCGR_PEP_ID=MMETSP0040_2-20121228/837_1 /TAXON_ID=641309 /ORGANISM="Lotharella oceanica, Strain CCMP622" /LENGTH=128 /DNA_ID=CAMNT_0010405445 /DNA_START=518 /DNA_END=901 /DNA_ORIENTATION=-
MHLHVVTCVRARKFASSMPRNDVKETKVHENARMGAARSCTHHITFTLWGHTRNDSRRSTHTCKPPDDGRQHARTAPTPRLHAHPGDGSELALGSARALPICSSQKKIIMAKGQDLTRLRKEVTTARA